MNLNSLDRKYRIILFFVIAIIVGFLIPFVGNFIDRSGHFLTSQSMAMDYIVAMGWCVLLGLVLTLLRFPPEIQRHLLRIWAFRCAITLGFMLFYESSYNLDAYNYFRDAIRETFFKNAYISNGTNFVSYVVWIFNTYLPVFDSYHSVKVIFSFIGLISIYYFYRLYVLFVGKENLYLLWAISIFPSIIFWSSILGKDPLALFGISMLVYGGAGYVKTKKLNFLLYLASGALMLSAIRLWLILIFGIPLVYMYLFYKKEDTYFKVVQKLVFAGGISFLMGLVFDEFKLDLSGDFLGKINFMASGWSEGGSGQVAPTFHSTKDLFLFAPVGMFTALFRPLPGEINNAFGLMSGLENLILFSIYLKMLFGFKIDYLKDRFFQFLLITVVLWAFLYGFVSYQNLGTAVRFRLQVLPVMIIIPFYLNYLKTKQTPKIEKI
jgi:hypothetical protein